MSWLSMLSSYYRSEILSSINFPASSFMQKDLFKLTSTPSRSNTIVFFSKHIVRDIILTLIAWTLQNELLHTQFLIIGVRQLPSNFDPFNGLQLELLEKLSVIAPHIFLVRYAD